METQVALSLLKLCYYSANLGITVTHKGNHGNTITMTSKSSFKPGMWHHSRTNFHSDHSVEGVTQSLKHATALYKVDTDWHKFLSCGSLSELISCHIVPHCVLTCLPLRCRDRDRPVVVVIASGLLADEVLAGLTVISVPLQVWCFQSHTAIL